MARKRYKTTIKAREREAAELGELLWNVWTPYQPSLTTTCEVEGAPNPDIDDWVLRGRFHLTPDVCKDLVSMVLVHPHGSDHPYTAWMEVGLQDPQQESLEHCPDKDSLIAWLSFVRAEYLVPDSGP